MSLPRSARRMWIVVLRSSPVEPAARDEWNRRIRDTDAEGDGPEALRTIGDLQPRRTRGQGGEQLVPSLAGASLGEFIVFTDVLDIRTGDTIRTIELSGLPAGGEPGDGSLEDAPDDGFRYDVQRVDRPGVGRRLDHLEVGVDRVTSGVGAPLSVVGS